MNPKWQLKKLFINTPDDGLYEGWVDPNDRWNGFQQPYFTYEQAMAVVDNFDQINPDETLEYDEAEDKFVVIDNAYGDILEEYSAVIEGGEVYYPIGYGLWIWVLEEEY